MDQCALGDSVERRVGAMEAELRNLSGVKERLDEFESKQEEMLEMLHQIRGAGRLASIAFYVFGPLVAAAYWLRDHLK